MRRKVSHLLCRTIVLGMRYDGGGAAIVSGLSAARALFARWLRSRPVAVRVANHLLQAHDLVAVVASIDSPVVKMPPRQVHLKWTMMSR